MNTRRKFLLKGSIATTALLTAKPFKSIANTFAPLTGFSLNNNKVVLVHTGNTSDALSPQTVQHITALKNSTGNMILLHRGDVAGGNVISPDYKARPNQPDNNAAENYKVIYKGDIKIGIIPAKATDSFSVESIDSTAGYLKKERNCHLVVCLSGIGYKSKTGIDDIAIAAGSAHIDVIIGGHENNYCKYPVIALNKNNSEVVISNALADKFTIGKIEIEFDNKGLKKNIVFAKVDV